MNTNNLSNDQKNLTRSDFQRQVLIGILLGDAHLESQNKGKTYRLCIEQSIKHSSYVEHLYHVFKDFVRTPPKPRTGLRKNNIGFRTISHGCFRYYAQLFYQDKQKIVPNQISKLRSPVSFAYWYMDDGSLKGKNRAGKIFCTEGFSLKEVLLLCESFQQHGFKVHAHVQRKKMVDQTKLFYRIYLSSESDPLFTKLIEPYIESSMMYKLSNYIKVNKLPKM